MDTLTSWFSPQQSSTQFAQLEELKFFIGDEEHAVDTGDLSPETTLNQYLREKLHLTGTKNMCLEGGCGSCIVAVTGTDPNTEKEQIFAVNSCLVPIYACSGWKIHTIESIGDRKTGYHPLQKAMVLFNGTQCGFCSSGMILNMYALYESGNFTMKEVENSFAGNICRCTGYRPILSAFKSLASDASTEILGTYSDDIEDIPLCKKSQGKCDNFCALPCHKRTEPHCYRPMGFSRWFKVFAINEIFDVLKFRKGTTYMLVAGNTATGVYKRTVNPDIYIDVRSVKALINYEIYEDKIVLGANMTLNNVMNLFYKIAQRSSKFVYFKKMADHIDLIANVPVRNTGTLAGNIFTKHRHHEFPSDIFLIFETVAAKITIVDAYHYEICIPLVDFLSFDMSGKVIKNFVVPVLDQRYKYESYKIMPRAQNAHAHVNAGFLFKFDGNVVESARIVYGAINPRFAHARTAEKYLKGKDLFDNDTLRGLFEALDADLVPDRVLPDPTPEFRKKLAIALCYKYVLSVAPAGKISPKNKTGGEKQSRNVSMGTQEFGTNKSMYPVTQPISKIEALAQCTGDATYIMDMPDHPGQLFAAFVVAKAPANSIVSKIDPSRALKINGVVAYYDKNDIPGTNTFTPLDVPMVTVSEELFCSGVVKYYFQPIGIVVATSQLVAEKAADAVAVSYVEGKRKPLVTVREILKAKATDKIINEGQTDATSKGTDVKRVIKGTFDIHGQYHYTMETQCCVVIPVEDGLDMYPSTQTVYLAQSAAAKVLNISMNKINVSVRRLGGGYGAKIFRNGIVSTAAALAAYKLKKPVKLSMPLITNMNVIGKREPFTCDYEVGVNDKGAIQYLNTSLYTDQGSLGGNENVAMTILPEFGRMYKRETWNIKMFSTRSDTPSAAFCRAPGTTEMVSCSENIMQHIATALNVDPWKVRLENLRDDQKEIRKYVEDLMKWAEVEKRELEVKKFNEENRWVKRGIAVVPMLYPLFVLGYYNSVVAIYQGDGSVAVSHGGIEMGQGINTKVAQACAYSLGIPLDQVSVKPSNSFVSANSVTSGGSITSELVCYATLKACELLKQRMKPIKDKMKDATWKELVRKCFEGGVDLSASGLYEGSVTDVQNYMIYGATCAEVEVDLLTGLCQTKRVDLLEDTGDSISPNIDIGQVEGAFVMGMGYWTSEELVYNEEGELLTNRTWNYKPPGVKDIPVDFRVKFPKNNPNAVGVLKSKATAEPPLCMTCSIPFAIRNALASARIEADPAAERWYPIDGPSTVENNFLRSLHDYKQYVL